MKQYLKRFKLSQNLTQLLIVMAGVFLGMLLTEWNSQQRLNQKKEAVLEQIELEVEGNFELLKSSLDRKRPFMKSLDSLFSAVSEEEMKQPFYDKPFQERFPGWRGMGGGRLDNAMYEAAKYSEVLAEVDIKLVKQIAKVYNLQEVSNNLRDLFINQFFQMNSTTTYADAFRLINGVRQELGGVELMLEQEYKVLLQNLKEKND